MSERKSDPPNGVMAALLAGWTAHDPVVHMDNKTPWLSMWGPHEGVNKDWYGCQCNFNLEPQLIQLLRWHEQRTRRSIAAGIRELLGGGL